MKNKTKIYGGLIAPLCNSCGYELNFVHVHLECIKCKETYDIRRRVGLDAYFWD